MIIAKIGFQQFRLKDVAAAEVLLKILNDSLPIEQHYFRDTGHVFSVSKFSDVINLSITQEEVISDEALEILIGQDKQKESI